MNEEDRKSIISNEYADLVVEYGIDKEELSVFQSNCL